jgi:outer membrane receptor protein involved in Fe transport
VGGFVIVADAARQTELVSLWGRNLTDKAYLTATVITTGFDADDYGRPRTGGVEFQYKY